MLKDQNNGVMISDSLGDPNSVNDFNMFWISEFKKTNAYEVRIRVIDPVLFDIVEPRHPCGEHPFVVADIGLHLSEGIQELKIDQQLAPAREAVTNVDRRIHGFPQRRGGCSRTMGATFCKFVIKYQFNG
ncbi:unnamed protein product [Somion occarium]|uniref:Uncharacterized protein n=1 Tax=Somion occarium TaxID=3059160 RepID=A0ABP1DFQ0_9APHY